MSSTANFSRSLFARAALLLLTLALPLGACDCDDDLGTDAGTLDATADVASDTSADTNTRDTNAVDTSVDTTTVDAEPEPPPAPVEVIITGDNAYGFGWGNSEMLVSYRSEEAVTADEIFACEVGPESYVVPAAEAEDDAYLYIVVYADMLVTQGVIAQFRRTGADATIYTGSGPWEACATGIGFELGEGGPPQALIEEQLRLCNAGGRDLATTSGGWVDAVGGEGGRVAVGEDNSTDRGAPVLGNEFLIACGIDEAARWMWYEPPGFAGESPFIWVDEPANPFREFIIFRLAADSIPPPPLE